MLLEEGLKKFAMLSKISNCALAEVTTTKMNKAETKGLKTNETLSNDLTWKAKALHHSCIGVIKDRI